MALKLDSNNRLWLPIPEEGVPYITNLSSVNFNILNTGEWRLEKLIEILSHFLDNHHLLIFFIFKITLNIYTYLISQHNQTVEKWPHPNFLTTWYLLLNKSPIFTGWYPPEIKIKTIQKECMSDCYLMPLSTIFQLYRGRQFYWRRKPEGQEKNHRPVTSHWETMLYRVNFYLIFW
jgi:hypothetical protein